MSAVDETLNSPRTAPGEAQIRAFATLWVLAFCAHYFESNPLASWPVVLAGIAFVLFPLSFAAFVSFVLVGTGVVLVHLPSAANHLMLALLVHLALAGAAGVVLFRRGPGHERVVSIFRTASPAAVLTLLVIYFFSTFHKLNSSFFDPDVSCSGTLLLQVFRLHGLPVVSASDGVIVASALLTVLTEGAILVLICVPRWRRRGVILGVGFHFLLALGRFYDFSSCVYALYILVMPAGVFDKVARSDRWQKLSRSGFLLFGVVSTAAYLSGDEAGPIGLRWHTLQVVTWALAALPVIVPPALLYRGDRPAPERWRLQPVWLLIVPILAFVNGAAPYLGLKTVASYSMFSNIKTEEGMTNHFIYGVRLLSLSDRQRDTVEVYRVQFPADSQLNGFARALGGREWLKDQLRWVNPGQQVRIPWMELRRAAHVWRDAGLRDVAVHFKHGDRERQVPDATIDPELVAPLSFVDQRLIAFRRIQPGTEPVLCRW